MQASVTNRCLPFSMAVTQTIPLMSWHDAKSSALITLFAQALPRLTPTYFSKPFLLIFSCSIGCQVICLQQPGHWRRCCHVIDGLSCEVILPVRGVSPLASRCETATKCFMARQPAPEAVQLCMFRTPGLHMIRMPLAWSAAACPVVGRHIHRLVLFLRSRFKQDGAGAALQESRTQQVPSRNETVHYGT